MIDSTINFLMSFEFTSLMGILLYWLPVLVCFIGYSFRTHKEIKEDIEKRDGVEAAKRIGQSGYYYPTVTIGTFIGRGIATLLPVVNLWAAVFDVGYELLSGFFSMICKFFNQPVIRERK